MVSKEKIFEVFSKLCTAGHKMGVYGIEVIVEECTDEEIHFSFPDKYSDDWYENYDVYDSERIMEQCNNDNRLAILCVAEKFYYYGCLILKHASIADDSEMDDFVELAEVDNYVDMVREGTFYLPYKIYIHRRVDEVWNIEDSEEAIAGISEVIRRQFEDAFGVQ